MDEIIPFLFFGNRWFETQDDILKGSKNINEFEVLMDHANVILESIFRRRDDGTFAPDEDFAFVWEIDARQHVHKSGLTGAILP